MYYIAYDLETKQILAFIKTNDAIVISEVFANFENYAVITTMLETPANYTQYKVVIEDDELIGYEVIENEVIENDNQ